MSDPASDEPCRGWRLSWPISPQLALLSPAGARLSCSLCTHSACSRNIWPRKQQAGLADTGAELGTPSGPRWELQVSDAGVSGVSRLSESVARVPGLSSFSRKQH